MLVEPPRRVARRERESALLDGPIARLGRHGVMAVVDSVEDEVSVCNLAAVDEVNLERVVPFDDAIDEGHRPSIRRVLNVTLRAGSRAL